MLKSKQVFVSKRGQGTGYSGIESRSSLRKHTNVFTVTQKPLWITFDIDHLAFMTYVLAPDRGPRLSTLHDFSPLAANERPLS